MSSKTTTNRLSDKAMLVQLTISMCTFRTRDKKVTNEVLENKHAEHDAGSFWTYLVPHKAMQEMNNACGHARSVHNSLTLPWNDSGCRILPSAMFLDYTKAIREAIAKFQTAVDKFMDEYPALVANAQKRLGDLLPNKRIPTVNEIRNKFGIYKQVFPFPDSTDFRVALGDEDIEVVRKQVSDSIHQLTNKAMTDLWTRLAELVTKVVNTLGEPKKVFRDSLISNLKEFCDIVPKLNLTDNTALESIRKEIVNKLTELKPDTLREDKKVRKVAHDAAKDVLEKMKGYVNI